MEALSIGVIAGFVSVVANPEILFNIELLKPVLEFFGIETSQDVLIYGAIFLILVFASKNLYLITFKYLKARFVFHRYRSIFNRLFNIYMNVPYSFHLNRNSAEIIRNVTHETREVVQGVILPLLQITTEALMVIVILLLLFIVEPVITLATVLLLGGTSFVFLKVTRRRMNKYGKKALKERAKIIQTANEGIGGFKDATVMNRQPWFIEKFEKSMDLLCRAHIFKDLTRQSVRHVMETIAIIGMLLIALFLLFQGHPISYLVSILALFALSVHRLLPAMNKIVSDYNVLRYHAYSIDPIYNDLTKLKIQEKSSKEERKLPLEEKIELRDVSFSYNEKEDAVLKNISLSIYKGSAVGIIGGTGSGKTTIADLILGLLTPTKGEVVVDGKNILDDLQAWQRNIGYIPQFIYLSDDTIRNNIAFGLGEEDIDDEKIERAAKMAQLNEFTDKLPEGLNTFIGEHGVRLSGGQRQRIGIARALYHNPEVLVMDEATSSLDSITERYVIEAIERLKRDRTIIIIAHRLSTIKNCDKLCLVKDKRIVAEGDYNSLLEISKDFQEIVKSAD